MKKIKALFDKMINNEKLSYIFFGGLTTFVNIFSFWLLNSLLSINGDISNVIAIILSIIFAYVTNKLFVFRTKHTNKKDNFAELVKFLSARGITMFLEIISYSFLSGILDIPNIVIKVSITVIIVILNYILSKILVFKDKK